VVLQRSIEEASDRDRDAAVRGQARVSFDRAFSERHKGLVAVMRRFIPTMGCACNSRITDAENDACVASMSRSQWIFVPILRKIADKWTLVAHASVGTHGASSRGRMNPAALLSVTDTAPHLRDVSAYPAFGALRNSRWFGGLSVSTLAQLARSASIRSLGARQEIVLDGCWLGLRHWL